MMKVLGITGGVGSGKSEVLRCLKEEYGAVITELDETARILQKKGTVCFEKIVSIFGIEVIGSDGELDRKKLAEVVFGSKEKLKQLNEIVHPEVKCWVREDIRQKREKGIRLYVIEAALLLEAGYEEICDEIWYIYTRENIRRERLKESRRYSDERIDRMIASQYSEEVFRSRCSHVIDNSGAFEDTRKQIGEIL